MTKLSQRVIVWLVILFQAACTVLFLVDFYFEVFSNTPNAIRWEIHEFIELAAIVGLILGFAFGAILASKLLRRNIRVEKQLRVVSGEFAALLQENFNDWGLSASEQDVALFAIKGMSNSEIAALRGTSEGTIKAQMNAVFKKAGFENRTQLLTHFFEELMSEDPQDGSRKTEN